MKKYFVVIGEHTLGCVFPAQRHSAQILNSFISKGATYTWHDGIIPLACDWRDVRLATKEDFITFQLNPAPYEQDGDHAPINNNKLIIHVNGAHPVVLEPEDKVEINKYLDVFKPAKELTVGEYFLHCNAWYQVCGIK